MTTAIIRRRVRGDDKVETNFSPREARNLWPPRRGQKRFSLESRRSASIRKGSASVLVKARRTAVEEKRRSLGEETSVLGGSD